MTASRFVGRVRAVGVVVVVVMAVAGCESDRATRDRVSFGRTIYVRECARCHGPKGDGYPGVYPALAGSPIVTLDSPEPMIEIVDRGRAAMPGFEGQIPPQNIAAVISYVRGAWGNGASPVKPNEVK